MKPMKTDASREITFRPAMSGQWLMTRDTGAKVRQALIEELAEATFVDSAVLDFTDLQAMTFSFADEFLGKFLAAREAEIVPPVGVVLEEVAPDPLETVALVIERRSQAVVLREPGGSRLLCRDAYLTDTYDVASVLLSFKAGEIADQLGITPQNANNRLKKLVSMGALRRERGAGDKGGKEFSYRVVR